MHEHGAAYAALHGGVLRRQGDRLQLLRERQDPGQGRRQRVGLGPALPRPGLRDVDSEHYRVIEAVSFGTGTVGTFCRSGTVIGTLIKLRTLAEPKP